jgi:sulfatase maturation enzyme AslB (radical SAM superfamily)
VSEDAWRFLEAEDTYVSTSFDGTSELHQTQRTKTTSAHEQFNANLDIALERLGTDRVSALPTIDPSNPPEPTNVIGAFVSRGFGSIFLRRVNYQGV